MAADRAVRPPERDAVLIPPPPNYPPDAPGPDGPDWIDAILSQRIPVEEPSVAEPEERPAPWMQAQPSYYPTLHPPAFLTAVPERTVDAAVAVSPKTRRFLYNASAAGAGWGLNLYDLIHGAIVDCGQETNIGAALVLGTGTCLLIAHVWDRRTRHWWIGLAWVARIPLATALTALALYAPGTQI